MSAPNGLDAMAVKYVVCPCDNANVSQLGDSKATLAVHAYVGADGDPEAMLVENFITHPRGDADVPRPLRSLDAVLIEHQDERGTAGNSGPISFNMSPKWPLNGEMSIRHLGVSVHDPNVTLTLPTPVRDNAHDTDVNAENPPEEPQHRTTSTETGAPYVKCETSTYTKEPKNIESDVLPQKRKKVGSKAGGSEGHDDRKRQKQMNLSIATVKTSLNSPVTLDRHLTPLPPYSVLDPAGQPEAESRTHLGTIGAEPEDFGEEFIAEIGLFAENLLPSEEQAYLAFCRKMASYDHGWACVGLPKSFRLAYDSLSPIPMTEPPSVDVWKNGGWEIVPLDAGELSGLLQKMVDDGWNDLDESDQESLDSFGYDAFPAFSPAARWAS
ncbi:MAG: hypothetical protein M1839_004614 [Geoglossum umbratile]|nr:MAG: hypothetical protein M1839_004614 [Geoglossum umbratile]